MDCAAELGEADVWEGGGEVENASCRVRQMMREPASPLEPRTARSTAKVIAATESVLSVGAHFWQTCSLPVLFA
eukprot:6214062-Pleurochrysis_carterae.AAC.3